MTLVGVSTQAEAGTGPAYQPVTGSTLPFTAHTKVIGTVSGSTNLTIQVWLKPKVSACTSPPATVPAC